MEGKENKAYAFEEEDAKQGSSKTEGGFQEVEIKRKITRKDGCYHKYTRLLSKVTDRVDYSLEKLALNVIRHPFIWLAVCFFVMGISSVGIMRFSVEKRLERLYIPQNSQAEKDQRVISQHFYTFKNSRLEEFGFFPKSGKNFLVPECVREAKGVIAKVLAIPGFESLCIKKPKMIAMFHQYDRTTNCSMLNPFELIRNTSRPLDDIRASMNNTITLMSNGGLPAYNENKMIARATKSGGELKDVGMLRVQLYLKNQEKPRDALDWEEKYLKLLKQLDKQLHCGSLMYAAHGSLDDAIDESATGDISLLSIAFMLMVGFVTLMLGKFSNPIRGHSFVAVLGIFTTGCGIGSGFAFAIGIGTPFVSMISVVPFLVLSIGIDDVFIIVDEFDKPSEEEDPIQRVPRAVRKVGATIAMTTLTDIVAFAVGISSDFPAIKYFCIYSAIVFAYVFFFIVTLFIVFLYFDARRIKGKRRECLPCFKSEDESCCVNRFGNENMANVIARKYATHLMKWPSKVAVILVTCGLLTFGIYGCFKVSQEFTKTTLLIDGSHLFTYLDTVEIDFDTGLPVDIYSLGPQNYADQKYQDKIKEAGLAAFATDLYQARYESWLRDYKHWSAANSININGANFTRMISAFLSVPRYARYFEDVKFDARGEIIASRTRVFMIKTRKSSTQKKAMELIRKSFSERGIPLVPYADHFIYFENYAAVVGEVTRNICLATVVVLFITLPFCVNPVTVLLILFGFAILLTELIGLMYFWDVSINSISMVILVTSVGFAIDYSAHVAHAFMTSTKKTVNERVIDAISSIGVSVFMGGSSTFLGMLVTAFASSELFRIFFRMMFGIVVFGLFNGLALLPVLFSIFGFLIGPLHHTSAET